MGYSTTEKVADAHILRLRGTIQRVDYQRRELKVVADGRVFRFTLDPSCRLSFDHQPAILRCFHPLDIVLIAYAETDSGPVIRSMEGWEKP